MTYEEMTSSDISDVWVAPITGARESTYLRHKLERDAPSQLNNDRVTCYSLSILPNVDLINWTDDAC